MCLDPRTLPDGSRVPCHHCWQCNENRINDWVGRCIAEKETALATSVVTLTYGGGDTPQSRFLRKYDVTLFLKAIRNAGHKVRYFAVGEYGAKKGRAHWHVVLFWRSPMPHRDLRVNINDPFWPHGFSMWDEADSSSIRYVMKYINKDMRDASALKSMAMSKKPILGFEFLRDLAGRYIDNELSPQRPFYKFREVLDKQGNPLEFYMPPLVAEHFITAFIDQWSVRKPGKHWPTSELVDKYHDKLVRYEAPLALIPRQFREAPWMLPPDGSTPLFDEKLNSFYCLYRGQKLFWSYDEKGQRAWLENLVTETTATMRQEAALGGWKR